MKALCTPLTLLALVTALLSPTTTHAATQPWLAPPGRQVIGTALDADTLWVTHMPVGNSDNCQLLAVSAVDGREIRRSAQFAYNARGLCVAQGSLWVVDARYDVVRQLSPTDFHEISQFHTPGSEPCGIAWDGGHLWLTDPYAQHTYELTTGGTVVSSFPIPNAFREGLLWDGSGLWMPTGLATLSHYDTTGAIDSTRTFQQLTPETYLYQPARRGDVWFVAAGPAGVYRIDPDNPWRDIAGQQFYGLASHAGILYATVMPPDDSDHCRVMAFDIVTGAELRQSMEFNHNARGLCWAEGSLWVVDATGDAIRQLDPYDFHEISKFSAPGTEPCGITYDGGHLWLTDPWYQHCYELTLTGSVVGSFAIPNAYRTGLEWAGNGMWMTTGTTTVAHVDSTGAVDSTLILPVPHETQIYDVCLDYGYWFVSTGSRIYRISMGPQTVTLSGREVIGVTLHDGILWASHSPAGNSDHGKVLAIDAATMTVLRESAEMNHNVRGVCCGDGSLWVVDAGGNKVWRVDPGDFHAISSFSTPGPEPCGITWDGSCLWLTDPYRQRCDQLSTSGTVLASFPIPNAYRTGLEWLDGKLWMPTAADSIACSMTAGSIERTVAAPGLPPGATLYDVAFGNGGLYVAAGLAGIVLLPSETLPITAVDTPGAASAERGPSLRLAGAQPVRSGATLAYELPRAAHVRLEILDVTGRVCAVLRDGREAAGPGSATWTGRDRDGHAVASGIYFARLQADREAVTRKLVVAR